MKALRYFDGEKSFKHTCTMICRFFCNGHVDYHTKPMDCRQTRGPVCMNASVEAWGESRGMRLDPWALRRKEVRRSKALAHPDPCIWSNSVLGTYFEISLSK